MRKDDLLQVGKRPVEKVDVEGVGECWFRQPSAGEWEPVMTGLCTFHRESGGVGVPSSKLMAKAVAAVLANPDGSVMFTEREQGKLLEMAPETLAHLFSAAMEHCYALQEVPGKKERSAGAST